MTSSASSTDFGLASVITCSLGVWGSSFVVWANKEKDIMAIMNKKISLNTGNPSWSKVE
jgi:hypothetical protein